MCVCELVRTHPCLRTPLEEVNELGRKDEEHGEQRGRACSGPTRLTAPAGRGGAAFLLRVGRRAPSLVIPS